MSRFASRKYRFLVIAYGLAAVAAIWEIGGDIHNDDDAPTPELLREARQYTMDYSKVLKNLYPESHRANYYRGVTALYDNPPRLEEAFEHFQTAIDTGIKSDEQLSYHYAVTLVLLDKDSEAIEEAVHQWRWNFPRSTSPDPRTYKNMGLPTKGPSDESNYR